MQSGTQSPILGLFWLASQNTGVDFRKIQGADRIQKAFQSVHHVVPPSNVDRYVAPSNQPYMNALLTLQTSVDQAAQMPTPDPAMASTTFRTLRARRSRSSRSRKASTSTRRHTWKPLYRSC